MATARQQFNVNLAPELVRQIKHHAIDAQMSLSDLITDVMRRHLERASPGGATMKEDQSPVAIELQPMIHVQEMGPSVHFYEALGARLDHGSREGDFVMMTIAGSRFSLLAHPPNPQQNEGQVELNFQTFAPLIDLEVRLRAVGVTIVQPTSDEGFGRQLQVQTPDGLLVKINELDQDLYD